jgi:prolipoprotein diacylglyceryl transferase
VTTAIGFVASLPSPPSNAIHVGALQLRAYGLSIALGVVAAVWIAQRRWSARGGDPGDISRLAVWSVAAGLVGARLYHVITDHQRFEGRWLHVFAIWEGGLGIPGGLIAGVLAGAWVARRRGLPVAQSLDVVAPAIPVAQAIGRLGNWFNQELYGRPTNLPWALRIGPEHRLPGYEHIATYHPTFLYEALWCLLVALVVVLADRRLRLDHGRSFALYVFLYTLGRYYFETLRIDPANLVLGHRVNEWVAVLVGLLAVGLFARGTVVSRRASQNADDMTTKQDV